MYINAKPSDDYSEAGIFLHTFDGICNPDKISKCNFNLGEAKKEKFFNGTVTHPDNIVPLLTNKRIGSPESNKYGDENYVFHSWDFHYGPAAGAIYYPCAVEKVCISCFMCELSIYLSDTILYT